MGGRIWAHSRLGAGSSFHFMLPFGLPRTATSVSPPPRALPAAAAEVTLEGLHVLVVEDNAVNLELALEMLRSGGISANVAGDGQAALAQLQTEPFDAVLMDIDKVYRSAELLLGILNDILDFSKIEAGRLQLEHLPFALDDVLEGLADLVALKAEEKHLALRFEVPGGLPATLVGDPLRLSQVLIAPSCCRSKPRAAKRWCGTWWPSVATWATR